MPWNTAGNIKGPKGDKGDPGNAADVATLIHAAASKFPVDADELPLLDSAGSWGLRKFTWSTLKALLQSLFFYRGNILGTVSQSSGVPTGAIIQRGSNSNGEFVRYADGTQLCWAEMITSSQLFAADAQLQIAAQWTFPASFIASPQYIDIVPTGVSSGYFNVRIVGPSASGAGDIYMINTSSASQNSGTRMRCFAIGRWF